MKRPGVVSSRYPPVRSQIRARTALETYKLVKQIQDGREVIDVTVEDDAVTIDNLLVDLLHLLDVIGPREQRELPKTVMDRALFWHAYETDPRRSHG